LLKEAVKCGDKLPKEGTDMPVKPVDVTLQLLSRALVHVRVIRPNALHALLIQIVLDSGKVVRGSRQAGFRVCSQVLGCKET